MDCQIAKVVNCYMFKMPSASGDGYNANLRTVNAKLVLTPACLLLSSNIANAKSSKVTSKYNLQCRKTHKYMQHIVETTLLYTSIHCSEKFKKCFFDIIIVILCVCVWS